MAGMKKIRARPRAKQNSGRRVRFLPFIVSTPDVEWSHNNGAYPPQKIALW
jgi:hypothetical protein